MCINPGFAQHAGPIVALTWHPANTAQEVPRFSLHVLDPTASGDDVELRRFPLNEGDRRVWCSLLASGASPGVLVNWADGQPGLSLRSLVFPRRGRAELGPEIALVTAHEASPWPPAVRQSVSERPGHSNLADILSPDRSMLYWREDVRWQRDPAAGFDPGGGTDLSALVLASAEMVRMYSAETEKRLAGNIAGWSPDSRRFAFQTTLPPNASLPPALALPALDLRVWDRATRALATIAASVPRPMTEQPPPRVRPVWSSDSRRLLSALPDSDPMTGPDAAVRLWWSDVEQNIGAPLRTQLVNPKAAAWLPDSHGCVATGFIRQQEFLVRGAIDQTAVVIFMPLWQNNAPIAVTALRCSPDGRWVLAAENLIRETTPTVSLWLVDLEGEEEPRALWRLQGESLMDFAWLRIPPAAGG